MIPARPAGKAGKKKNKTTNTPAFQCVNITLALSRSAAVRDVFVSSGGGGGGGGIKRVRLCLRKILPPPSFPDIKDVTTFIFVGDFFSHPSSVSFEFHASVPGEEAPVPFGPSPPKFPAQRSFQRLARLASTLHKRARSGPASTTSGEANCDVADGFLM